MQLIKTIIRPHKLEEVQDALNQLPVSGMTISEVVGRGRSPGVTTVVCRGVEYRSRTQRQLQLELIVADEVTDDAVRAILKAARTGRAGDGVIVVTPVTGSYRIRTGDWER
jgi:nitrogen regulatory protein P-II 1